MIHFWVLSFDLIYCMQGDLSSYYRFLNELGTRFHASHHLVMRMAQFIVLLQVMPCSSVMHSILNCGVAG